ncbi:MAG: hypothetical protein KDA57_03080 [Planctomycetales bacterium]|nr:hypothetical protein [Planctomycetales bacterium]
MSKALSNARKNPARDECQRGFENKPGDTYFGSLCKVIWPFTVFGRGDSVLSSYSTQPKSRLAHGMGHSHYQHLFDINRKVNDVLESVDICESQVQVGCSELALAKTKRVLFDL